MLELQREVWRWNDESCIRSGLTKSFGARLRRQRQRHQRHLLTPYLRFDSASSAVDERMDHHQHLRGVTADETAYRVRADGEDALDGGQSSGSSQTAAVGMGRRLQGVTKCRSSSVFYDLRVVEFNDIPFYPDHVQVRSRRDSPGGWLASSLVGEWSLGSGPTPGRRTQHVFG